MEVVRLSRNTLDQYSIWGAEGFEETFKRMLAEVSIVWLEHGRQKVQEEPWFKQLWEHVQLVDKIARKLLEYKPLLEAGAPWLLGGG